MTVTKASIDNASRFLRDFRDGGAVKRTHTCRTLRDATVAEHSHGVILILLAVYSVYSDHPPARLLAAAACHDLSEIATGDIPAPVKRAHPDLRSALNRITTEWEQARGIRYALTDDEAMLLKWADYMEFAMYATEEVRMGNSFMAVKLNRIVAWIEDTPVPMVQGSTIGADAVGGGIMLAALEALGPHRK